MELDDADLTLIQAFNLGMGEEGWTDQVMDEAERLLPTLIAAGYLDDEAQMVVHPRGGESPGQVRASGFLLRPTPATS